jgi:antitoxin (DNA-binding transcriptional repressor) of toxin-antitoxin stability system
MKQVTLERAAQDLNDLVDAAVRGEEIILRRDDRSAVRLVPVPPMPPAGRPTFGSAKGLVEMSDDFDEPLHGFLDSAGRRGACARFRGTGCQTVIRAS